MSTYIYGVRKSKKINVKIAGESQPVYLMQYTSRLSQFPDPTSGLYFGKTPRWATLLKGLITRIEDNYQPVKFIAIETDDKFEDGLEVYLWNRNTPWWYDSEAPGQKVGVLRSKGKRGYTLEPVENLNEILQQAASEAA